MKNVLVCGGRDFTRTDVVYWVLDNLRAEHGDLLIINGGARGADQRAREWCAVRGMACATVEANWEVYGLSAGPLRNRWMLALGPSLIVAFPGGVGTENMVTEALAADVEIIRVNDAYLARIGSTLRCAL